MNEEISDADLYPMRWRNFLDAVTGYWAVRAGLFLVLAVIFFCVTSCATSSSHYFSDPTSQWTTKTGQIMYQSLGTTLIGEAVVGFSKSGDFELTVSKGPGITLFSLRQDATFAEVKGGMAGRGWSGPTAEAPSQLHAWLGLRDEFLRAPDRTTLRYTSGDETFVFRF